MVQARRADNFLFNLSLLSFELTRREKKKGLIENLFIIKDFKITEVWERQPLSTYRLSCKNVFTIYMGFSRRVNRGVEE